MLQNRSQTHPVFSFADGEMGVISNKIIRYLEKLTGQPRIEKLYFDYVNDNLNPEYFWSDALDRLRIELDIRRSFKWNNGIHTVYWTGRDHR